MASTDDVKKLADLARIGVPEEDLAKFAAEFDSILGYVGQINELSVPAELMQATPAHRNVFRADENPHETGAYTDKLAAQFPAREGDSLVVKKIISND